MASDDAGERREEEGGRSKEQGVISEERRARSEVGTRVALRAFGVWYLTCSLLSVEVEKSPIVLGGNFASRKRETSGGILLAFILV